MDNKDESIIVDTNIPVKMHPMNMSYFKSLGYPVQKNKEILLIKFEDLQPTSKTIINVQCPICKKFHQLSNYQINQKGNTRCYDCSYKKMIALKCDFCDAEAHRREKGFNVCNRHRNQIRRYGKPIQGRDLNKYEVFENHTEIILTSQGKDVGRVLIDNDEFEKIKNIRWYLEKSKNIDYSSSFQDGRVIRIHTLILEKKDGYIVDHINHNGLDNRKINLRYTTLSENSTNTRVLTKTYSGIKGVSYDKKTKKWIAYIVKNNIPTKIGRYDDLEDARLNRLIKEKELHGNFGYNEDWSNKEINIMGIIEDSVADGEGLRTVCFVSGCDKFCKGCHNPDSWNVNNGKNQKIGELVNQLVSNELNNVTISGGCPLSFQRREVYELVKEIKIKSKKNIWLYTGFTWEEIIYNEDPIILEILKYTDVIVDGRFEADKKDLNLKFRGSSNSRIVNVQESIKQNKLILWNNGEY